MRPRPERRRRRTDEELRLERQTFEREWRLRGGDSQLSVLLVNCLPDEQDMYAHALSTAGYIPLVTCRQHTAMDMAVVARPDVVVTDISIEDGGLSLIRALRRAEETRDLLIVAVSGHVFDRDRIEAMRAGCDIFLPKPCLPDTLVSTLDAALRTGTRTHDR